MENQVIMEKIFEKSNCYGKSSKIFVLDLSNYFVTHVTTSVYK